MLKIYKSQSFLNYITFQFNSLNIAGNCFVNKWEPYRLGLANAFFGRYVLTVKAPRKKVWKK